MLSSQRCSPSPGTTTLLPGGRPRWQLRRIARSLSAASTLAPRAGGYGGRTTLFVTYNANAANQDNVTYTRVDSLASNDPERFISSIYIDPANKNHVWVSYSGYNAHTP